jgi:hypothetical protein
MRNAKGRVCRKSADHCSRSRMKGAAGQRRGKAALPKLSEASARTKRLRSSKLNSTQNVVVFLAVHGNTFCRIDRKGLFETVGRGCDGGSRRCRVFGCHIVDDSAWSSRRFRESHASFQRCQQVASFGRNCSKSLVIAASVVV